MPAQAFADGAEQHQQNDRQCAQEQESAAPAPAGADPIGRRPCFSRLCRNLDVATKANGVVEAEALQKGERFDVDETPLRQNRHGDAVRQTLIETGTERLFPLGDRPKPPVRWPNPAVNRMPGYAHRGSRADRQKTTPTRPFKLHAAMAALGQPETNDHASGKSALLPTPEVSALWRHRHGAPNAAACAEKIRSRPAGLFRRRCRVEG
jgi:hypothetical protein